jgi:hypothetical protein
MRRIHSLIRARFLFNSLVDLTSARTTRLGVTFNIQPLIPVRAQCCLRSNRKTQLQPHLSVRFAASIRTSRSLRDNTAEADGFDTIFSADINASQAGYESKLAPQPADIHFSNMVSDWLSGRHRTSTAWRYSKYCDFFSIKDGLQ